MPTSNNKQIAKNTLLLYFRMLFLMAVSLYTSRVILDALGVEDFGIYNVVGGVVAMFNMLSGSLSAAITRFITFELGKGDADKLKRTFSSAVTIQIGLGLIMILLIESVGVWFLNVKMNIPAERMTAANWVLQFSLVTFFINLISVPYNAAIIAHERMSAFAYISILEAVGKLSIAFLILWNPFDRLVFYALLMMCVAIAVRLAYSQYCTKHFGECHYHFIWDKELLRRMFGFAGWNFIGAASGILRDQGGNIVINLFCGPAVNAARGVAVQVNGAISSFVQNFQTALNPQITKSYAAGDNEYMLKLLYQGARLSFYMLLLLSLPVLVNTHYILCLWLKEVPEHTTLFVQLILLFTMCESVSGPLITAMLATGRIRNYQLVVGGLQMLNLPISYILLRYGMIPETVVIVAISVSICCLIARLIMLRGMIGLSIYTFVHKVCLNVVVVTLLAALLPVWASFNTEESFSRFIWLSTLCLITTMSAEYFVGCNRDERAMVRKQVGKLKNKLFHGKKS